jgi:GT2 family glycosyltransferase
MYSEDIDLCYKSHICGFQNYYIPTAHIIHHGGGSSKGAKGYYYEVMMREARWRFFLKFHGRAYAVVFRGFLGASAIARSVVASGACWVAFGPSRRDVLSHAARKWRAVLLWAFFDLRPSLTHAHSGGTRALE